MPATTQLLLISKFEKAYLDPNGATFFRSSYDPYSNFAIESVENSFQQNPVYGGQSTCRLTNQGDVLIGAYMEITASQLVLSNADSSKDTVTGATQLGYTNSYAHALCEESQFKIGGVEMDKIYSEWFEIYSEYYIPGSQQSSYNEMVGKLPGDTISTLDGNGTAGSNEYILPFRYWWEKPGVGVPTAALEGIDIEITVRFRNAISMVVADVDSTTLNVAPTFTAKIWVDFAFVSDDEREFLVVEAQTYLISQLMRSTSNSITWTSNTQDIQFQLHFNLPATDLFWICQLDSDVTQSTGTNRWFKYGSGTGASEVDLFSSALLKLNNANREEERKAMYFRNYRPFKTHTRSPGAFIYEFAFALFPEAFQPSGSMNFSKLDQATLVLTRIALGAEASGIARAYIRKYNTFTVVSGTAGVGFSS